MRDFASPTSRAAALSLPARILYTVFALMTLAGCISCVVIYDGIVRFGARTTPQELQSRVVAHYETIDRQKLVETTHAHLFTMPVLLLVAGHLFLLCRASMNLKLAVVIAASLATVLHVAAPRLVIAMHGNALAAALYPPSGGLLLLVTALMLSVPVWQMWSAPSRDRSQDAA
ncbi:MAG TPA: hypothetical protein VHB97_09855 [Polyangia bacterium]|jgi:hypothetical protein|nr:hypothetical protein [Polyangia bacterium]